MRMLKNENGYALIIVLLTITVIGIFTPLLITSLMNSSNQYKKAEEKVQMDKLSEMGETYLENAINKASIEAKNDTDEWLQTKPIPTPDKIQIANRYMDYFTSRLSGYIHNLNAEVILNETTFRFRVVISTIKLDPNSSIKIGYKITPTLNVQYDNANSVDGDKTIELDF